ncbi:MAG: alpha-amylase [Elusimicrobia bacterium CG08_land_8_20_14_0_20_59_10]|nr:MAG: alpha-amylase [Elusimicrobia bacterium CG08_land_8_20_14_0_20_59_10]
MKNSRALFALAVAAVALLCRPVPVCAAAGDSTVMIQGFHWTSWKSAPWWGVIKAKAPEISAAGIDLVWLPPPSDSSAPEGYMPRRLAVLNSAYGTEAQLAAAVRALHSRGVRVIGDIVVNHRVGTKDWADFTEPAWGDDSVCSDDEWGKGKGARDTGKGFHAARDIDHTKPYVRSSVKAWLNGLRDSAGFDGWRYDYARGFTPAYMLEYNRASGSAFSVAELWDDLDLGNTDGHRQASCDWMDATGGEIKVFDFTTKGILQAAMQTGQYWRLADKNNRPSGLLGWWPANSVTFLENHDTGSSPGSGLKENAWPFPSDKVPAGYAYLLTHPGIPCIYWPHFFDPGMKTSISALIKLRRAQRINSTSAVRILKADTGVYAAVIDDRTALRIGDRAWNPGAGWTLAAQGPFYTVWTK